MNKHRVIPIVPAIVAVVLLLTMSAWAPGQGKRHGSGVAQELKPPSELALLMRAMTAFSDSTRMRLSEGRSLPEKPDLSGLFSATPTDGELEMDRDLFERFAQNYLDQVENLYAASGGDQVRLFNGTVNACSACHQVSCPGPLMKIRKLYLP
ncbi:MAG: hypothetical protein KDB88_08945 [Flavobacteriales bacterium]|nr:hypothetical protein [Flavobacteriales bacterium]